jgi:DNA-binding LacI/PurR family transcriptional regulator
MLVVLHLFKVLEKYMAKQAKTGRPPRLIEDIAQKINQELVVPLKPGEFLPTETELVATCQVSRTTIRAALVFLERGRKITKGSSRRRQKMGAAHLPWTVYKAKRLMFSFGNTFAGLRQGFASEIIRGILNRLEHTGINLNLESRDWRVEGNGEPAEHLASASDLGAFLLDRHPERAMRSFQKTRKPLVAVDFDAVADGLDSVCLDNIGAGALLARRLRILGHDRIAAVFEAPDKPTTKKDRSWSERQEGFLTELRKNGVPAPVEIYVWDRAGIPDISPKLLELLQQPASKRPTAILLPHAGLFSAVQRAVKNLDLHIPQDLTVFTFGQTVANPAISGVHFDGELLGGAAAEQMLRLIRRRSRRRLKARLKLVPGRYLAGQTHIHATD